MEIIFTFGCLLFAGLACAIIFPAQHRKTKLMNLGVFLIFFSGAAAGLVQFSDMSILGLRHGVLPEDIGDDSILMEYLFLLFLSGLILVVVGAVFSMVSNRRSGSKGKSP